LPSWGLVIWYVNDALFGAKVIKSAYIFHHDDEIIRILSPCSTDTTESRIRCTLNVKSSNKNDSFFFTGGFPCSVKYDKLRCALIVVGSLESSISHNDPDVNIAREVTQVLNCNNVLEKGLKNQSRA